MAENKEHPAWEDSFDEDYTADDETLSFCHFSMVNNNDDSLGDGAVLQSPRTSFEFELLSSENELIFTNPDIFFCRPDPISLNSMSYEAQSLILTNGIDSSLSKDRTDSLSFLRSSLKDYSVVNNQVQTANITSLTTMTAKSRRRMFMFGPVKFKPEMELSAIKDRQGRRHRGVPNTNKMFMPKVRVVAEGGETVVAGGGDRGKRNQWKLICRTLRGRVHFSNVFAKSCGCLPLSVAGVGKLIAVAE